jgi:hypothetical protein
MDKERIDQLLKLLKTEAECVHRNETTDCGRECSTCDLACDSSEILNMYQDVISYLKNHDAELAYEAIKNGLEAFGVPYEIGYDNQGPHYYSRQLVFNWSGNKMDVIVLASDTLRDRSKSYEIETYGFPWDGNSTTTFKEPEEFVKKVVWLYRRDYLLRYGRFPHRDNLDDILEKELSVDEFEVWYERLEEMEYQYTKAMEACDEYAHLFKELMKKINPLLKANQDLNRTVGEIRGDVLRLINSQTYNWKDDIL